MKSRAIRNAKGQMLVESILILTLLTGVSLMIANYLKDNQVVRTLVSDPWMSMAGMLQNGIWGHPDKTSSEHPTAHKRHIVIEGERAK